MIVAEFKNHLTGELHGGSLNKVRNFSLAMKRAANVMLAKIDPINTIRTLALTQTIHDEQTNYALPTDFKKIIDLYPQVGRTSNDTGRRIFAEPFDLRKNITDKKITIEGQDGAKIMRVNWKTRQPKTINELNSLTNNGTWAASGTATNVKVDTIDFVSGNGSIKFDLATSGDGIQNTTMNVVDLTAEDEVADFYMWFKVKNAADLAKLTAANLVWGNDLTTKYWTGVPQTTQSDGTAFQVGWNQILFPWSTAIETGVVDPATIDALKLTFTTTGAITQIHVDNVVCAIGKNFEIKEYSKFILQNSNGTWISETTSDDDIIVLDDDCIEILTLETLIECAQQMEGSNADFDISFADRRLNGITGDRHRPGLYARYRAENPSMSKKAIGSYGTPNGLRHFRRWY